MSNRIVFIDNAKAIGIVLVVFAHLLGVPKNTVIVIYSFHMPLFFFISGYLVKQAKLNDNFWGYAAKQFRALIVPYFFFGFLLFGFLILENVVKNGPPFDYLEHVYHLIYGIGRDYRFIGVLWFFTCLFCVSIYYYLLRKMFNASQAVFVSLVLGFTISELSNYISFRLPWNLELAGVTLFFYAVGNFVSLLDIKALLHDFDRRLFVIVGMVATIVTVMGAFTNGRVDMNGMQFGNPFLFYLTALSGIIVVVIVGIFIKQNKPMEYLSQNTIVLYPMHLVYFAIFTAIGQIIFHMEGGFQKTLFYAIVYTIGAILVNIPVAYILKKVVPSVIGMSRIKV